MCNLLPSNEVKCNFSELVRYKYMKAEKIIKKLIAEGYKLKAHHNNKEWKKALEDAEAYILEKKKEAEK